MTLGEFLLGHFWELVALGVLLLFSGFFSGTETALFNLTRGQLHRLGRSRHALSRLTASLMARPRTVLNTLLLGNMIVNVAYAGDSAMLVLDLQGVRGMSTWHVAGGSLVAVLGLILIGEVTPKMLAFRVGERWAVLGAGPYVVVEKVLSPILWVLDRSLVAPMTKILAPRHNPAADITADELATLVDLSAKRGIIDPDAETMLRGIMELTELRVGDIMVPRVDVVAYDVNDPSAGLAELFRNTGLRRIPVYEGDVDHVLGIVHAKRLLLNPDKPLRELAAEVFFVPEAADLEKVLLQFRVRRRQMAVVVDEYGGTAGLVTLEDVLEQIVGEIPDDEGEAPPGPVVERIGPTQYRVDGMLAIHAWVEAFKMDLDIERYSTIGGLVVSLLGRPAGQGDEVIYRNLRFVVESLRGRRVDKVRLELREAES